MTIAGLYIPDYREYWNQPRLSGLSVLHDLNGVSLDELISSSTYSAERRQLSNADIRTTVIAGFKNEGHIRQFLMWVT